MTWPWQPIETVPEDKIVDLFKKTKRQSRRVINCRFLDGRWLKMNGSQAFNKGGPTHWMHPPEEPTEEVS